MFTFPRFSLTGVAIAVPLALWLGVSSGCSSSEETPTDSPTYYGEAKAIIDSKCATCHQPGDIGPFPLTNLDEVKAFAGAIRSSIENGTMPPWQPSADCNSYQQNIDLNAEDKQVLLTWLDSEMPAGDAADAPVNENNAAADEFVADISLRLPEPYTPTLEPDDYRCQLIEWPADETRYVTGVRVRPDQRAIVHHVILFLAEPEDVEAYRAFDAAEDGPGYTCYGGPSASSEGGNLLANIDRAMLLEILEDLGISPVDLQMGNVPEEKRLELIDRLGGDNRGGFTQLGSWVPGTTANPYPAGTGIRVEPGSLVVAQIHYNTQTASPVADQSTIEIATVAEVEREATLVRAVDLGWVTDGFVGRPMTIPAGASDVRHETTLPFDSRFFAQARNTLGLNDDAPLVLHTAAHHMHELGKTQRSELRRADGNITCLLENPDWDFSWQGEYRFEQAVTLRPGDSLWMGCTFDNSEANQPIIDGEVRQPVDVAWGEGTSDEMCLGGYYVTAE